MMMSPKKSSPERVAMSIRRVMCLQQKNSYHVGKRRCSMIPKKTIILLSGIPATRKSTFARYLAGKHDFAHYDIECDPNTWPHPELYQTFMSDRPSFVARA